MKKLIFIITVLSFSSCLRLDNNLYNNSKVDQYKWDAYTGKVDFYLDASYNISVGKMNELTLVSKDTTGAAIANIKALYVGDINTIANDTIILYCHGNRDHMDSYWPRVKLLANMGSKNRFGVLMFDYRGFGMSEGDPTEEGMNDDLTAALEWLKNRGVTSDHLIIYGFSLGSAPVTKLLAEPRSTLIPSKLILENPFASAELMVQDASRLALPSSFFTNVHVDVAEKIKKVQQPFLLLSSAKDKFLKPETHANLVSKNYNGAYKEVYSVAEADHSTLQVVWGYSKYLNTVQGFITK